MNNPLVSIIVPTYNRAHLLGRAINSVLCQTFKDWELIIIDDNSNDNTIDIINNFLNKGQKIIYIKLDKNSGGASLPRNVGINIAKGDYIAFLDSDDEWLPEKLEKQVNLFLKLEKDVGIVYTGAFFIDQNKNIRIKRAIDKGFIYEKELSYNPVGSPSRVMVRSECFKNCGLFDDSLLCAEDWDMWIRISKNYKVEYIDIPLVNYIESSDSISINFNKLIIGYKKLWEKHNIFKSDRYIISNNYARLGHRLCFYGDMGNGRNFLLKSIKEYPYKIRNIFIFCISFLGHYFYFRITNFLIKVL